MIKRIIQLGVLFLFCFSIFIASSYVIHHINIELTSASEDLNVDGKVVPLLDMIVKIFQIIFGILSLGIGLAIIITIIMKQGGDDFEIYG